MKIVTNHQPRELVYGFELSFHCTKKELKEIKSRFDYLDTEEFETEQFFKYKNYWYSLGEFLTTSPTMWTNQTELKDLGWDGYLTDSYFSATLVKFPKEDDRLDTDYIIAGLALS